VITLEHLRVLRAIQRHGSIAAAARSLHLSQPTVSHHLAAFEALTGGALVERSRRGSSLTELGELTLAHAELILDQVEAAENEIHEHVSHGASVLRVGTFPTAGVAFVAEPLGRLAQLGADYELTVAEAAALVPALRDHRLHIAVIYSEPDIPSGVGADIRTATLLQDRFAVLLPPGHPAARQDTVEARELAGETWISGALDEDPVHRLLIRAYREIGVEIKLGPRLDDFPLTDALVAAGLGVALIPETAARQLAGKALVRRLADPRFAWRIDVAWHTRPRRPLVERLAAEIQAVAAEGERLGLRCRHEEASSPPELGTLPARVPSRP
jgi:molybdate transport repressor ModE-like protein